MPDAHDKYTLEACHIDELIADPKGKNEQSDDHAGANTSVSLVARSPNELSVEIKDPMADLRARLRACKTSLKQKLDQEFPVPAYSLLDKQCFGFLRDMQAFYLNNELPKPQNLSEALGIVSDHQMQEVTTDHRFKLLGIGN